MSRLSIQELPLAGLMRVERQKMGDSRGFLSRIFCAEELESSGWTKPIAQINYTYTARKGTVRGMHFQRPPHAEMKLVSCLRGEVWDVVVDLRVGSPTFLRWHAERLSTENCKAILIPEGFAHGFQTLTDDVELLYCHSNAYVAWAEGGLNPCDPTLGIAWQLPITEMSTRDAGHAIIGADFKGVQI
jgi:dTDP-4-dehydrorhamnose 3,5-epimerase